MLPLPTFATKLGGVYMAVLLIMGMPVSLATVRARARAGAPGRRAARSGRRAGAGAGAGVRSLGSCGLWGGTGSPQPGALASGAGRRVPC